MKTYTYANSSPADLTALCQRPGSDTSTVIPVVTEIMKTVRAQGDQALFDYTRKLDGVALSSLEVTDEQKASAIASLPTQVKTAIDCAALAIETFHQAQVSKTETTVETYTGVKCSAQMRPISSVGLYIPGGTAPLFSTILMLAIPARIAGCTQVVLCTPPGKDGSICPEMLYAAQVCSIKTVFQIGGAQAIAAMAYGTECVPKADKIFGPGNQYVTAAKMLVASDPAGAAIDMPAGPSEVLIITDKDARADFIAADLLSQAEHGADSQVVLVSLDSAKITEVQQELDRQIATLPRKETAEKALANSFSVLCESFEDAMIFANQYAPEHLIINIDQPDRAVPLVQNAGSVFLGPYACESAGDYASGTNHVLPTYGYARSYSGVSLTSFQKRITFQTITADGAKQLGPTVALLAEREQLTAHQRAMEIRFKQVDQK